MSSFRAPEHWPLNTGLSFLALCVYERAREAQKNGLREAKSCNKRRLLNIKNKEGSLQQPNEGFRRAEETREAVITLVMLLIVRASR